ncbi:MAG: heavy-metal-associated domain-containing protein [Deltaproteobacteria bacterium]
MDSPARDYVRIHPYVVRIKSRGLRMSHTRQMKKINLETLEQAERKVSLGVFKKALAAVVIVLVVGAGAYGAFRLLTGEVLASRFTVGKMYCPACVITVREVTEKLPGVVSTDISLAGQEVTVRFRSKQTGPERIKEAIAGAGYPTRLDAVFTPGGSGDGKVVIATVNNRPVFRKDMEISRRISTQGSAEGDDSSAFFSIIGKEILLQAADKEVVVVQTSEIEAEAEALRKKQGLSEEEMNKQVNEKYGSVEKFHQVLGQTLGIRKLLLDTVLDGIKDPKERERKTLAWVGTLFKDADVKILDPDLSQKIKAASGLIDWKTFWPRMIGRKTELKGVLMSFQNGGSPSS